MEDLPVQIEGSMLNNASLYSYANVSMSSPSDDLNYNDIYQGVYILNNEEYFCLMKRQDENHFLDIITNELWEIKNFNRIILFNDISFIKNIQLKYKTNKSLDLFKVNSYNLFDYSKYIEIIRFFNLSSPYLITSPIVDQSILDGVIEKMKKFFKRYDKSNMIDIYVSQLKKFNTLKDVLNFCPKELLEIITPFWIPILKECGPYDYRLTLIPIKVIETINSLNLNIIDLYINNKEKLKNEINKLIDVDTEIYKEKCKVIIEKRIKDGKETIAKEINDAKENVEMLFELDIIKEELNKIENHIEDSLNVLTLETNIITWWPELLYPIPTNIKEENKNLINLITLYNIL